MEVWFLAPAQTGPKVAWTIFVAVTIVGPEARHRIRDEEPKGSILNGTRRQRSAVASGDRPGRWHVPVPADTDGLQSPHLRQHKQL